ncbi:MAG TPA: formyltransferase family protein [Gammaproteobacteria bacterium]|nr:formyltransferase family protein [Gammaproteobacteria bacterium]
MSPEARRGRSFALLASGAGFSCAVLQALLRRNHAPELLLLPEFAPASKAEPDSIEIVAPEPARRLLRIAGEIETGYAPRTHQQQTADLLSARSIEFILVACWPYLIGETLAGSVAGAALNLHPSLLPRYRGPDPLRQQQAAGDERYGVTLHLIDRSFDHGDIVAQAELSTPGKGEDSMDTEWRCAELGALLFVDALRSWPDWKTVAQASL